MLSRGYIAGWADKRNTVEVIDIQGQRGYPVSINAATAVNDVYDPAVLIHDLEAAYADIETAGTPAIVKLREGALELSEAERAAMIAFLQMHWDRGRLSDRAELRAPALVLKTGNRVEKAELRLGDALVLSQSDPESMRLEALGIAHWEWRVWPVDGLVTGDGAVLLWQSPEGTKICTVSFPLSPTRLLIIGDELPDGIAMNDRVAAKSKRWIVGARGSLNLNWANATSA